MILEPEPLVFCSGNFCLCRCVRGCSFPLSILLESVYLVLCGVPWSTWTWALYKEIRMGQFAFFYVLTATWASTVCWICSHFPTGWSRLLCKKSGDHRCVGLILGMFNSIPLIYLSVSIIVENSFCFFGFFVIPNEFENCSFYWTYLEF